MQTFQSINRLWWYIHIEINWIPIFVFVQFSNPFSDLNITLRDIEDSDHCLFYTSLIISQKTGHINSIQQRRLTKWYVSDENKNLYTISHSPAWYHPRCPRTRPNVHREVRVVEGGSEYDETTDHPQQRD